MLLYEAASNKQTLMSWTLTGDHGPQTMNHNNVINPLMFPRVPPAEQHLQKHPEQPIRRRPFTLYY